MKNDAKKNSPPAPPAGAPDLSEAQAAAVHHPGRDVCVSAAAGSGKTRVLVERFAKLVLQDGVAPDRIIAITYTQKAADELRERIERRLAGAGRHLLENREPAIGTIHGFCLRLLQENAIDAGLDPLFRVLQGDLYEAVVEEAIEEVLDEAMRGDAGRFAPMLEYAEPGALKAALLDGYERVRTLGRRPVPHPAGDPADLRRRVRRWTEDIKVWKRELPEKQSDRLGELPDMLLTDGADDETLLDALVEIAEPIRQIKRTKALAEAAEAFLEELEDRLIPETADAVAAPYNARFAELLDRLSAAVALRKRLGSWVDLHDLMDRAVELLERPAFQARVRADYAALLIDEYQDVNALQAKLLDRLGEGLAVFVVGDARQSIYGFRHSESAFFMDRLERARENGAAVEIPQNYRSRPGVIDWVNRVFSERPHGSGVYGALQPCRPPADGTGPAVEYRWTAPPAGERPKVETLRKSDAAQAAAAIRRQVDSGAAAYGDIAVLMSRMTALPAYEDAFRRSGIPYHVMRGRGFYEKSEIVDLVNLFRAVRDPQEPIYRAALFRSPFAGLRDEEIWSLFRKGARPELPPAAQNFLNVFEPLAALRRELTLGQILERALSASAFEAVTLAQPDGLRRFANIRKFKDVLREFENLYGPNLDAFVARLEERMDAEAEERETEAAVASERGNAVRVLTVHASKGLEFPVVIAADLSGTAPRARGGRTFVVDPAARIVSNPPGADEDGRILSASYDAFQEARAAREAEESVRLFYVAATRARERLILCGSLPAPSAGSERPRRAVPSRSWTDLVLEAFPETAAPAPEASAGTKASEEAPAPPEPLDVEAAVERLRDRSRPYRQTVDLSVSDLAAVTGESEEVPPAERRSALEDGDEEATLLGASSAGRLFHEMLQHAVYAREPKDETARLMRDFAHRMDAAARAELEKGIGRFLESRLAEDLRASERAGRPIYRELPFFCRIRSVDGGRELGSVKGQVDLLFESPDGKWTLVDYKTTVSAKAEHHDQLRIYAFCLKKLLQGRPHRAELFYSRDGSLVPVDLGEVGTQAYEAELVERFEDRSEQLLAETD